MRIGNEEYAEILVTDINAGLIASITDKEIIEDSGYKVVCKPVALRQEEDEKVSGSIEQEESRIKPKLDECIISVADKIIDGKSTLSECDYVREIQALSSLVDSRAMLDR